MMQQIKLRSIDVMIRKLDCSVFYNNRTEKLLKLEPKKIQKSDENLRVDQLRKAQLLYGRGSEGRSRPPEALG
jgi:hypothetical protein